MTPAGPSRARRTLGALFIAALGLGLMAIAISDARALLEGWGTDRLQFGAAMFIQPWMTLFLLLVSAVVAHGSPSGKASNRRLGLCTLVSGALGIGIGSQPCGAGGSSASRAGAVRHSGAAIFRNVPQCAAVGRMR